MLSLVINDIEGSSNFSVSKGIKQGCLLAPMLFSMTFSVMLMDTFQKEDSRLCSILHRQEAFQSQKTICNLQSQDNCHPRHAHWGRLCFCCIFRARHVAQHGPVFLGTWQLWAYHQLKEDWSNALTSCRNAICWTHHHSAWVKAECGGQVHIAEQHTVKDRKYRLWGK